MLDEINSSFNRRAMMKTSTRKEAHDIDREMRSAKSTMTNVIVKTLCSIPGYHILESYKDRICASLPDDYNNTALRLQTLIGASDHMIQWILTGDMSKANHRIYQVVLVFVCFEPHFIKFCDIMEAVLATALIKQLYTDGHITAKEAAELTSNKLFKVSVAAPSFQPITRTIDDIIMTTMTSSNFSTELCIRAAETTTDTTFSANVQLNNVSTGVSSPPCIAVLGEHSALPQHICMSSNSPCAAVNANKMKTIITPDVTVAATSNEGLQSEKYINDATTIFSLKKMNGRNIPHQIPIISSEIDMHSSVVTNTLLSVHDVQESSPTKDTPSTTNTATNGRQSIFLSTNSGVYQLQLSTANSATSVSGCDDITSDPVNTIISSLSKQEVTTESDTNISAEDCIIAPEPVIAEVPTVTSEEQSSVVTLTTSNETKSVNIVITQAGSGTDDQLEASEERNEVLLKGAKNLQVASSGSEVHSTMHPDPETDVSTVEFGSKEVYDILKAKDFAIVKAKYAEILSCFPENFEATINCLQNYLSDSDICNILSLTSDQNQKLLNLLILRLKNKEDLLDFCDNLEKIDGASPSLKDIAEQLRKQAIEMISNSEYPPSTSKSSQTAATSGVPPAKPPRKIIPFHIKLLEIPEATKPFDRCLLGDDSEGLAALKKCYPILIENLPSNHLISLVRLQDVAIIPEEIVDTVVPSPSAEIGNKMIMNYLIGLIHTEEHVITFCHLVERMTGEFDKCICILNLRNTILMSQKCEMIRDDSNTTFTAEKDKPFNTSVDISCDELRTQYADQPDIRALIKAEKPSKFYQPFLHECGAMVGYLKCILINSHKPGHDDTPTSSDVTDEPSPNKDIELVKGHIKRDYLKEYAFSLSNEQGILPSKQQYLESIEVLFRESAKGGVMIYYTGCGEKGTGNWCFQDGVISLNDILSLYDMYLKERLLVIYADCSYSGQWALDYANYLDEMGIGACGHQIIKQKKFLKIFTSCRPNQKGDTKSYATKALKFDDGDDSLWVYTNLQLSASQTTYGCNFSKIQCLSVGGPSAPCQLSNIPSRCRWKWRDILDVEYNNRPGSRVFTVRGKDKGRQAWHIVLVEKDLLETFRETVDSGTVDVAKFGHVIKSGWGKDPPDDIVNLLKKNG